MLLTRCPKCKCDFKVTDSDANKELVACPTCGYEAGWDRRTGFDVRFPKLEMSGSITPHPEVA